MDRLRQLCESVPQDRSFPMELLKKLNVEVSVSPDDLGRIPRTGPVIAISNHPFGLLDGAILASIFLGVRSDVRIVTNRVLRDVEGLTDLCFFLDPFDKPELRAANGVAIRQAIAHVRTGGLLVMFPAGEVSHFDLAARAIRDPEWQTTAARLVRITRAPVLPLFVGGSNGLTFQMLGMVHPRLRTAALPNEFLNKRDRKIDVRVGNLIDLPVVAAIGSDKAAVTYLRFRCELLGRRGVSMPPRVVPMNVLAEAEPADAVAREIANLPALCLLDQMHEMDVYMAEAPMIPATLREIGRLREATFRSAGEGSGLPRDIDRFDMHYLHLFVWNRAKREIVGAYRMGDVPRLLASAGQSALYTDTLFRFDAGFLRRMGPALELGRSFVRVEYQKQFQPLLLLWKGITAYIARRPEYAVLIGAVSVSSRYSPASRELMAGCFGEGKDSPVKARRPLRGGCIYPWEMSAMRQLLRDAEDLGEPIQDLEADGKGIPVLVRQYLKLGGRLLAFSVDPDFANTLDGFVMLDLRKAPLSRLVRYMGKDKARAFLEWHAALGYRAA